MSGDVFTNEGGSQVKPSQSIKSVKSDSSIRVFY